MRPTSELAEAILKVCPITGTSHRVPGETVIHFAAAATTEQRAAAANVAREWDWSAPSQDEQTQSSAKGVVDKLAGMTLPAFQALTQAQKDTVLFHIMKLEIRRLA